MAVLDDRPDFASAELIPEADRVICADFEQALSEFPINENTYIVMVTRGHKQDELSLRATVASQAAYVGMEACRDCHAEAFDIWERTPHSRAYWTLEIVSKNYNLSCVACHVTGYQRPGGTYRTAEDGSSYSFFSAFLLRA